MKPYGGYGFERRCACCREPYKGGRARERRWNRILLNEADAESDLTWDLWADELLESEYYQATVFPGEWPRTKEQIDADWAAYLALPP